MARTARLKFGITAALVAWSAVAPAVRAQTPDANGPGGALARLEAAAEHGDAAAQATLGTMYFDGQGVVKDHRKALTWNEKAAAQNRPDALLRMGLAYHQLDSAAQGDPPEDGWKASGYWIKAYAAAQPLADAGNPMALEVEGELLYWGWTGESKMRHDEDDAMAMFRKSAEGGYARAQVWLGSSHAKKQPEEAMRWFFKAALQGSSSGMAGVAHVYQAKGQVEQAKVWLSRAAMLGDLPSSRELYSAYGMTVGDPKLDYVAGGRLNPNGAISLPNHRQATSDPTMQVVAGILAFSAIAALLAPKVDSSSSGSDGPNEILERMRNEQEENSRQMRCMMAGDDPGLLAFAGPCY